MSNGRHARRLKRLGTVLVFLFHTSAQQNVSLSHDTPGAYFGQRLLESYLLFLCIDELTHKVISLSLSGWRNETVDTR